MNKKLIQFNSCLFIYSLVCDLLYSFVNLFRNCSSYLGVYLTLIYIQSLL